MSFNDSPIQVDRSKPSDCTRWIKGKVTYFRARDPTPKITRDYVSDNENARRKHPSRPKILYLVCTEGQHYTKRKVRCFKI